MWLVGCVCSYFITGYIGIWVWYLGMVFGFWAIWLFEYLGIWDLFHCVCHKVMDQ